MGEGISALVEIGIFSNHGYVDGVGNAFSFDDINLQDYVINCKCFRVCYGSLMY